MTSARREAAGAAGSGLFLASSWTWCIGMYLPLILLREWGWRGFWLFAAVNVIGAAAVGAAWTPSRARSFVQRRRSLLAWFSLATIAYQSFFLAWVASEFVAAVGDLPGGAPLAAGSQAMHEWAWWGAAVVGVSMLTIFGSRGDGGWKTLGAIATIGSFVLWASYGTAGWARVGTGLSSAVDLWMLAPAIALGFIVCPHLDLSFQRVAREASGPMPWIVFTVAFLPMLLFAAASFGPGGPAVTGALVAWWLLQACFTCMVHARELRSLERDDDPSPAGPLPATVSIAIAVAVGAAAGSPLLGGESMYLRFLGLYGAVFPGIALLLWRGYRSLAILGFLALAVPCFEAGFLGLPAARGGDRIAWAPLVPIGVLLGLLLAPINNGAGRAASSVSAPDG